MKEDSKSLVRILRAYTPEEKIPVQIRTWNSPIKKHRVPVISKLRSQVIKQENLSPPFPRYSPDQPSLECNKAYSRCRYHGCNVNQDMRESRSMERDYKSKSLNIQKLKEKKVKFSQNVQYSDRSSRDAKDGVRNSGNRERRTTEQGSLLNIEISELKYEIKNLKSEGLEIYNKRVESSEKTIEQLKSVVKAKNESIFKLREELEKNIKIVKSQKEIIEAREKVIEGNIKSFGAEIKALQSSNEILNKGKKNQKNNFLEKSEFLSKLSTTDSQASKIKEAVSQLREDLISKTKLFETQEIEIFHLKEKIEKLTDSNIHLMAINQSANGASITPETSSPSSKTDQVYNEALLEKCSSLTSELKKMMEKCLSLESQVEKTQFISAKVS